MLTRRRALMGAFAAGALLGSRAGFAKASQPATPVDFDVPGGACDCHTHLFLDPRQFPFWPGRAYTPEMASPAESSAMHRALHIDRIVVVTASVYGTNNSAALFGLKALGVNSRGVAVIDEKTPESDLDTMAKAGVRGIRLNLVSTGQTDPGVARQRFQSAADRMRRHHWHIQIYAPLAVISGIKDAILDSPVPVVFDHFGGSQAALGVGQSGFGDLLDLLRSGKAYVKLSGAYRASQRGPDYPDAAPLAQALIAANADRVVWGSDWPHPDTTARRPTEISPLLQIDDGRLFNQLAVWAPEHSVRRKILVDNPTRLYGF